MAVRTKQLALFAGSFTSGTPITLYTVPAGHVTILRSVTIMRPGGAGVTVDERIAGNTFRRPVLAPDVADVFEVWRVLKAGDTYALRQSSGAAVTLHAHLSGAELEL